MSDSKTDVVSDDSAADEAIMNMLNPDGQETAETANAATEPDEDSDIGDDGGADELGDKGKQALDRMKAKWRAERDARRELEEKLAEATDTDGSETQRRQIEAAALAKANARIVKAELKAAAAGKFADPADALYFLDPDDFEVDDDGNVDEDEIAAAVTDLLTRKPHLAAQGGPRKPQPDRSQGETGSGTATTAQQFAAALDGLI